MELTGIVYRNKFAVIGMADKVLCRRVCVIIVVESTQDFKAEDLAEPLHPLFLIWKMGNMILPACLAHRALVRSRWTSKQFDKCDVPSPQVVLLLYSNSLDMFVLEGAGILAD